MRLLLLFPILAFAQTTVTRLELKPDPSSTDIRPGDSAIIQVRAYGQITSKDKEGNESTKTGRLADANFKVRLADSNGGYLSKGFKFQGADNEAPISAGGGLFSQILKSATNQFTVKDSFLYTAPDRPGRYRIEVTGSNNTSATIEFNVKTDAPQRRPAEKFEFDATEARTASETKNEPHRKLAEHYAPFIAQETWFDPKADIPTRFDYDKDWNGGNNWRNLDQGTSQAYVHYAVMETATHWFLHYNFFHPRDYSDNCVAGTCHENDNEGLILMVAKGEGGEFGKLLTMETLAHNNVYSYVNDNRIGKGFHNVDGRIHLYQDSHPMIFIEAGGHGVLSAGDSKSFLNPSNQEWKQGTGITLVYKGRAERPKGAVDKEVGYELLPIYEHWWLRATAESKDNMFDAFYAYQPFGGRPGTKVAQLAGTFYGREKSANKAKPFWGWHDTAALKKKVLATGQWALDPAYAVQQNLKFPADMRISLDYTSNPYLGIE